MHVRAHTYAHVHMRARARSLGRACMDKGLVYHRDLCLTTHSFQETDIHAPVAFKHAIPVSKQPQTHTLDHLSTRLGWEKLRVSL